MSFSEDTRVMGSSGASRPYRKVSVPASRLTNLGKSERLPGQRGTANVREMQAAQSNIKGRAVAEDEGQERWPLPGLAPMTRVRTNFGDVHAVALRKGDEVLLRTGEYKPIVWINRIMLDEHILSTKPDSNPVVLSPGALGASSPAIEVMVSPRQKVLGDATASEAGSLLSRPGVRRLRETSLSYTMFHVGEDAEVYCEGLYLQCPVQS